MIEAYTMLLVGSQGTLERARSYNFSAPNQESAVLTADIVSMRQSFDAQPLGFNVYDKTGRPVYVARNNSKA